MHVIRWPGATVAASLVVVLIGWPGVAPAFTLIESQGLVFTPSVVEVGQEGNLCALNVTQQSHQIQLSIVQANDVNQTLQTQTMTLPAGGGGCINFTPVGSSAHAVPVAGLINFVSPGPCRASTGALPPGPCRIVGSLEIDDVATHTNRLHIEGRWLPAVQMPQGSLQ